MEIKTMKIEDIEARMAEIKAELDGDCDVEALNKEVDALEARKAEIEKEAEARSALIEKVSKGEAGKVIEKRKDEEVKNMENKKVGLDSAEYRNAWLKNLKGLQLDEAEARALNTGITYEITDGAQTSTQNKNLLVPTEIVNNIWDLVSGEHPIVGDVDLYRSGCVMEFVRHTESSGATITAEGSAPNEEQNTFEKITLAGKDFSKYVDITYAMKSMAIPALQSYLENEIATAIGEKIAEDIVAMLGGANGVAAANKVTITGQAGYRDLCQAFGKLKRAKDIVIYGTRETIFNQLVPMTDDSNNTIFKAPIESGTLGNVLGANVKVEDAAGSNLYIGAPKKIVYNMVQDIMIESDRDIKAHVITHSGYARGEGALIDDLAFVIVSFNASNNANNDDDGQE